MPHMERRSFFKFIGLPALFLPLINLFPSHLKKPKTMSLYVDGTKVAESESFPLRHARFGSVVAKCPKCGLNLKVPYIEGSETYHYVQTYPCLKCGGKIKFDALIKTIVNVGCHFHP